MVTIETQNRMDLKLCSGSLRKKFIPFSSVCLLVTEMKTAASQTLSSVIQWDR